MIDFILYLFLGFCALIIIVWLVTGAEWCQKLMLKKYFPEILVILNNYQIKYNFWKTAKEDLEKVDNKIKWHTDRIEYYFVTNQRDKFKELNELYLERKRLEKFIKKYTEQLEQDKFLIEAYTPFILFSEFHEFKILDRQEFNIFDIMWVHRKQKKFEKNCKKTLDLFKRL